MNGFENIEQRVRLRQQFKDEAGTNWENMQGEPDIDYVLWLENKALYLADVVGRSEQLKAFADWLQSDTANLNYDFRDLVDEYLKSL